MDKERLKLDCGFISVCVYPTGDARGAKTIVELTQKQIVFFNKIPEHEIRNKLIASQTAAQHATRGGVFCKGPTLQYDENKIIYIGSALSAEFFFRHFFQSPSK